MEKALQSIGTMEDSLTPLDTRADPDAQSTVTDFLDFTEYLPADMIRSLTLIGNLDRRYVDASMALHDQTTTWGELPLLPADSRPAPAQLRLDISENLHHTVGSRVYSHTEAVRMAENVNRHYNRANTILKKLTTMLENYPTAAEQEKTAATLSKSPQLSRAPKTTSRLDGQKARRPRVPRITVPGEVLAPYDLNYDAYSTGSDISSSSEEENGEETRSNVNGTTSAPPRIKLVKGASGFPKPHKAYKSRTSVPPPAFSGSTPSTSAALLMLKPPPENAVIGSADAPWGQLTPYELAKLRKRMKKNSAWAPSETMIARELKSLGRGLDAYKAAKQKAEEEGRPFDGTLPTAVVDPNTGIESLPEGGLSEQSLERNLSNRGMKLNEAKKLKREQLAKLAAEEAEESTRKMIETARAMFDSSQAKVQDQTSKAATGKAKAPQKRKRDSISEVDHAEKNKADVNGEIQTLHVPVQASQGMTQKPQPKRPKTETPVPPPQRTPAAPDTIAQQSQRQSGGPPQTITPIPPPQKPCQDSGKASSSNASPVPSNPSANTAPSGLPAKSSATLEPANATKPVTHIPPPNTNVRETRKQSSRKQESQQNVKLAPLQTNIPSGPSSIAANVNPKAEPDIQPSTPAAAEPTSATLTRRPGSRGGKAQSQEPAPSLAADRPRRASTARNTPAPEKADASATRLIVKRAKRPAPGVISRTNSGGNSAVGARKAAPRRKKSARKSTRGDKSASGGGIGDMTEHEVEIEVDDEGKAIDPEEPRYCLCNRVSFGMMIECDNVDVSTSTYLSGLRQDLPDSSGFCLSHCCWASGPTGSRSRCVPSRSYPLTRPRAVSVLTH